MAEAIADLIKFETEITRLPPYIQGIVQDKYGGNFLAYRGLEDQTRMVEENALLERHDFYLDWLPHDEAFRWVQDYNSAIQAKGIQKVVDLLNYLPLDTPVAEIKEVLTNLESP